VITPVTAVDAACPAVSRAWPSSFVARLVSARRNGRALYLTRGGHVRHLVTEILAADSILTGEPDHG